MTPRRRSILAVTLAAFVVAYSAGCSTSSRSATSTTTSLAPSATDGATSSTTTPAAAAIVFATVDGAIDAYLSVPPYTRQRVIAAGTAPNGNEPHGQICFAPDGSRRFVVAETKAADTTPASAGWGLYQLTGDDVGALRVRRVSGWTSPSGIATDDPTTYGCAFLSDGRLLTSDVGNQRSGDATGRLVEWFPPYEDGAPTSCVLSSTLATPLGLSSDAADNVYLASARAPTVGVWRYSGTFPSDATGCVTATTGPAPPNTTTTTPDSGTPPTTSPGPTVTRGSGPDANGGGDPSGNGRSTATPAAVTATLLIPPAAGPASAPTSVAATPDGLSLVVSSAPFGSIAAYGSDGVVNTPILSDPSGAMVAKTPFSGGTPLGVAVGPDGVVFYADPGLVQGVDGVIAPGDKTGTIRRLATSPGFASPPPPDPLDTNLRAPDGLGLYLGVSPQSGGASKA